MSIKGPSNKTYIPIWYSLFKYKYGQKKTQTRPQKHNTTTHCEEIYNRFKSRMFF